MTILPVKSRNELIKQVDDFLNSKEIENLSDKDVEYLSKTLLADKLKEELKNEIKKAKLDVEELKGKWLSIFKSKATKISYSGNVDIFLNWIDGRTHIVSLKAGDADDYIAYLKREPISDNTLRLRIASVSSFLSYLQRIDVINKNPFNGARGVPAKKIEVKTFDEIPNDRDIEVIEEELRKNISVEPGRGIYNKVRAAKIGLLVISIIKHHGLRVGALNGIMIDRKGFFKTVSKGSSVAGKFHPEVLGLIKELGFDGKAPLAEVKTETIKIFFQRFLKRLYRAGKIGAVYSLHDLRHYAAIKMWEIGRNIYALKRFLNHKSIATTQVYLSSLRVEIGWLS